MRMFEIVGDVEVVVRTQMTGEDRIYAEERARGILEMLSQRTKDLSPHLIEVVNVRVGIIKEVKKTGVNVGVEKRVVAKRLFKIKKLNEQSFEDFVKASSRRVNNDVMMALLIFREAEMNSGAEISFEKGFQRAGSITKKMQFLEFADLFGAVVARTGDIKIKKDVIYGGPKFVLKETVNLMIATVQKII